MQLFLGIVSALWLMVRLPTAVAGPEWLLSGGGCEESTPIVEVRVALPVDESEALQGVIESGDGEGLARLFEAGVSTEVRLPDGDTPLVATIRAGREDLAALCLDWCAGVEARCAEGAPPLALAVAAGQDGLARRLVEAGAGPDDPMSGPVPAVIRESFEAAWLVNQLRHDTGVTPLMLAVVRGNEPLVQFFIEHGARPYQRTHRYKMDSLSLACRAGEMRIGQRLLRRDPDDEGNQKLVVVLGEQRVTLFRGAEPLMTSQVSTGRKGYATPPGEYLITSKHRDWTSTIYNSPMPYLLRLNASPIGLHQGVVPGYPASHGCIRLPAGKAASFFKTARIGDRVLIQH